MIIYYKANIKFYLFDCYKWSDDSSEGELFDLNYYGLARVFKDYGSRYPNDENINEIDLYQWSFDGIFDQNLSKVYIESLLYYDSLYSYA